MKYTRPLLPFLLGCVLGVAALSHAGKAEDAEQTEPGPGITQEAPQAATPTMPDFANPPGYEAPPNIYHKLTPDEKGGITIPYTRNWQCWTKNDQFFYCVGELAPQPLGEAF